MIQYKARGIARLSERQDEPTYNGRKDCSPHCYEHHYIACCTKCMVGDSKRRRSRLWEERRSLISIFCSL